MNLIGVLLVLLALAVLLTIAGVLWASVRPGRRRGVPGRDVDAATIQARVRAQRRDVGSRGDTFGDVRGL